MNVHPHFCIFLRSQMGSLVSGLLGFWMLIIAPLAFDGINSICTTDALLCYYLELCLYLPGSCLSRNMPLGTICYKRYAIYLSRKIHCSLPWQGPGCFVSSQGHWYRLLQTEACRRGLPWAGLHVFFLFASVQTSQQYDFLCPSTDFKKRILQRVQKFYLNIKFYRQKNIIDFFTLMERCIFCR